MFTKFRDWYQQRHEYAKKWKAKTGGKVIGYFCTYVPEEILYAANILPVRILGSHEPQDLSERHIFGMYCPFCRDCLAQGLKGRYDYLDGIMIAHSCLHIRQAFTSWQLHIPVDYSYYLYFPAKVQSPASYPYLTEELNLFKQSLQKWLNIQITDAMLENGIKIMNRNRMLLHRLYELRKAPNPPLTGLDAMYAVATSQFVDKEEHSAELESTIERLKNTPHSYEGKRLIFIGSENDDIALMELIESLGAVVVVDEHCTGTRYFWNNVKNDGNKLAAIAQRYLERIPCPSKDWERRIRLKHIANLVRDYKVEGAVLLQQKFCDPHECDLPVIASFLNQMGVRTLYLELDVTVPKGQFKVRAEAFLEMLREEDLF